MTRVVLAILIVLLLIFVIPIIIYGSLSALTGLKTPEGASPMMFLLSVFVIKIGTATAFVLLFYIARNTLGGRWLMYAFIWWLMFLVGEIGQAIGPSYSWLEAFGGVISETVYFPLSAFITSRLVKQPNAVM